MTRPPPRIDLGDLFVGLIVSAGFGASAVWAEDLHGAIAVLVGVTAAALYLAAFFWISRQANARDSR